MRSQNKIQAAQQRRHILDAAARRFIEQGFHATAMKDVCLAAGLSPGTVYHYFASKTDIIRAIVERESQFYQQHFAGLIGSGDLIGKIGALVDELLSENSRASVELFAEISAEIIRSPELREIAITSEQETRALLIQAIEDAKRRGQVAGEVSAPGAAVTLLLLLDGLLLQATLKVGTAPEPLLDEVKAAIARMLQPTPTVSPQRGLPTGDPSP